MSIPTTQAIQTLQGQLLNEPNSLSHFPAFTGDSKKQQISSSDFGLDPPPAQEERLVTPQTAAPCDRPEVPVKMRLQL